MRLISQSSHRCDASAAVSLTVLVRLIEVASCAEAEGKQFVCERSRVVEFRANKFGRSVSIPVAEALRHPFATIRAQAASRNENTAGEPNIRETRSATLSEAVLCELNCKGRAKHFVPPYLSRSSGATCAFHVS